MKQPAFLQLHHMLSIALADGQSMGVLTLNPIKVPGTPLSTNTFPGIPANLGMPTCVMTYNTIGYVHFLGVHFMSSRYRTPGKYLRLAGKASAFYRDFVGGLGYAKGYMRSSTRVCNPFWTSPTTIC